MTINKAEGDLCVLQIVSDNHNTSHLYDMSMDIMLNQAIPVVLVHYSNEIKDVFVEARWPLKYVQAIIMQYDNYLLLQKILGIDSFTVMIGIYE